MLRRNIILTFVVGIIFIVIIAVHVFQKENITNDGKSVEKVSEAGSDNVIVGSEEYRGFVLDNVLHSNDEGDIHYNVYIPDTYDGSEPYQTLYDLYRDRGLSDSEIDKLLVLDIKGKDYFEGTRITYRHGGGYLFCRDKEIMGWLFNH